LLCEYFIKQLTNSDVGSILIICERVQRIERIFLNDVELFIKKVIKMSVKILKKEMDF
jgi:hypothetical protein